MLNRNNYIYIALITVVCLSANALAVPQYARPNGTVSTGTWTVSGAVTHHEAIDEISANNGTDYVETTVAGTMEVNLSGVSDPGVHDSHTIRLTVYSGKNGGQFYVELYQDGSTLIATSTTFSPSRNTWVTRTYTLPTGNAANISNYSTLSLRIVCTSTANNYIQVTMAELEIPEASFSPPTIINPSVSGIGATSATFGADVTSDGGDPPVSDRGTVWKTSPGVTATDAPASQGSGLGSYFHLRTGLPPKTIIYYAGYATNSTGTTVSSEDSFRTEPDTQEPTAFIDNAGASDMRINWSNTHTGDGVIVLIKENGAVDADPIDGDVYADDPIYPNGEEIGTGNRVVYIGTASNITVTNLSPGSTYFIAVYAYAGSGSGQTGINYIQTSPATASQLIIGPPALTTVNSSNMQATTADLQITIFSDGGGTITQHGTMWNTTGPPIDENQTTLGTYGGAVPGSFNDSVAGLDSGSLIYFRGYGTNGDGTAYSSDGTFYTEPTQAATVTIDNVTETSMRVNWIRGNGDGAMVVIRQDSAVSATPTDGVESVANNNYGAGADLGSGNFVAYLDTANNYVDITDLVAGHTYHIAVYEYKGSGAGPTGVNYREESPPTNSRLIVGYPTIITPTFDIIAATSATLGADIINNGGDTLSARGTIWNTIGMPDLIKNPANAQTAPGQLGQFTHSHVGLQSNSFIFFRGYATNSFGTSYSSQSYFYTEPATAPTNITISSQSYNYLTITWTKGESAAHIVLVKQGSPVDASPVDGVVYSSHSILGSGDELGTGNFVVAKGTNSYVSFAGLTPDTTYHIAVYSYSGMGAGTSGINYLQASPAVSIQTTDLVPFGHNGAHDVDCVECHTMHAGGFVPRDAVQEAVCVSCHNPDGEAPGKLDFALHDTSGGMMDCGTCHEMHNNYDFNTTDTHAGGITAPNVSWIRQNIDDPDYYPTALPLTLYHGAPENPDDFWGFTNTPFNGICQTCHTSTDHHTNDGVDPAHPAERGDYVGQPCIACHPHDAGFAPVIVGGSCLDAGCHDQVQGTRRDVLADFGMTSHHVSNGSAVQADCQVCHMENPPTLHSSPKMIDLRDPDTGNQIQYQGSDYSFSTLTRDTTGDPGTDALEEWVTVVQNQFCFKCHDSDGAAYLGPDAMTPFSTNVPVPNVFDRFDTATNTWHHSVRGPGSNPFTVPHSGYTTMASPWNQDTTGGPNSDGHDVISCFDCHGTNTHGNANQRMLRTPIDFDTIISEAGSGRGGYTAGINTQIKDFCVLCHDTTTYATGSSTSDTDGSAFQYHAPAQNGHLNSNDMACFGCHAGFIDDDKDSGLDNGAAAGSIHGGSYTWPSGSDSEFVITDTFVVGGWMSGWLPGSTDVECWGGNCNHFNSAKKYPIRTP